MWPEIFAACSPSRSPGSIADMIKMKKTLITFPNSELSWNIMWPAYHNPNPCEQYMKYWARPNPNPAICHVRKPAAAGPFSSSANNAWPHPLHWMLPQSGCWSLLLLQLELLGHIMPCWGLQWNLPKTISARIDTAIRSVFSLAIFQSQSHNVGVWRHERGIPGWQSRAQVMEQRRWWPVPTFIEGKRRRSKKQVWAWYFARSLQPCRQQLPSHLWHRNSNGQVSDSCCFHFCQTILAHSVEWLPQ